jgi:hypothetical protein
MKTGDVKTDRSSEEDRMQERISRKDAKTQRHKNNFVCCAFAPLREINTQGRSID